jgi:twinkle protein
MIVDHDQIHGEVRELWKSGGLPKGAPCGWPTVDQLYTVGMGQWTLITGTPGSGKSEWLDAVMVNLAKSSGKWKFVIFSPENWPLALHHSKIIEKYIGKPFNPGPTPRLDEAELDEAETWMRGKFYFAKPDRPTIVSILNEANKIADEANLPAYNTGIVIDPWNQLEHHRPPGLSETEYVSQTLSEVINWTRARACHLWLVAHPSKLTRNKEGKLPVPTPHDVSGSAHFWNKADNCVTVWRDQVEGNQDVQIHVQKVRFKHIGRVGLATLKYDRVTGKYFEPQKADVVELKTRGVVGVDF